MAAALVLLLVGLGALAAGVLIGRYYVPDDRQLRRTARHANAYVRALGDLIARDHDAAIAGLRAIVEENVEDVEPYFALGGLFRARGEHERAIRVHQALAMRERDQRKLRQRALYELGLDFRAAGMPRRATRALEEVLLEEPEHDGARRALAALYEEQARYADAAALWQKLGKARDDETRAREHHLLVAAAQAATAAGDHDGAKAALKAAQRHGESPHYLAASAELAAARDNPRGAKELLLRALVAEPGLARELVPTLAQAERALAPADTSDAQVDAAVLADLAQIQAQTGPALPLLLMRAELARDPAELGALARELASFSEAPAARVAAARLALASGEPDAIRQALEALLAAASPLADRWQCARCGHRPDAFGWRCTRCRRWGALHVAPVGETAPAMPRERRERPRAARPAAALPGSAPALPAGTGDPPALAPPASDPDGAPRRSVLGRVGGWFSGVLRRTP